MERHQHVRRMKQFSAKRHLAPEAVTVASNITALSSEASSLTSTEARKNVTRSKRSDTLGQFCTAFFFQAPLLPVAAANVGEASDAWTRM